MSTSHVRSTVDAKRFVCLSWVIVNKVGIWNVFGMSPRKVYIFMTYWFPTHYRTSENWQIVEDVNKRFWLAKSYPEWGVLVGPAGILYGLTWKKYRIPHVFPCWTVSHTSLRIGGSRGEWREPRLPPIRKRVWRSPAWKYMRDLVSLT